MLKKNGVEKINPPFYGSYKVIKYVGDIAYELEFPP